MARMTWRWPVRAGAVGKCLHVGDEGERGGASRWADAADPLPVTSVMAMASRRCATLRCTATLACSASCSRSSAISLSQLCGAAIYRRVLKLHVDCEQRMLGAGSAVRDGDRAGA